MPGYAAIDTEQVLRNIEDVRRCALAASPAVKHVRVRLVAQRRRPALVEVRPRGRFRRKLKPWDFVKVHLAIVERKPVNIELRMVK